MILPFENLVITMCAPSAYVGSQPRAVTLRCGKAVWQRLITHPPLFHSVDFSGDRVRIGVCQVEFTGDPDWACLTIHPETGATVALQGTVQ